MAVYEVAARRIGSVSVFVVINMALQVGAQMMIAKHFGAGQSTDAYFMARDIADLFGKFFLTGQITVVLMPLFLEFHSQKSPGEGIELMRQVINIILIGVGSIFLLLGLGAPLAVYLLAPGFAPGTQAITVGLFRILLLSTFLTLLVSVAAALLNAFQRFTLPRATAGLLPLGLILALWMFKPWGGVYALAWGLVAGNGAQAAILFASARREGLHWHIGAAPWRNEGVRRFFWLMVPFFGAYAAVLGQGAIFKIIVSYFPTGSFSTLSYAGRIMKALFSVTLTAFNVVIFHTLARQAVGGKMEALAETTTKSLRMILFVLLPLTAVGIALSTPIVRVLLERGSFTEAATSQTSWLLVIYLTSMPFLGCSMLLTNVLYSLHETRVAVKISVGAALIQAALYWPLAKLLGLSGLVWTAVCSSVFLGLAGYQAVASRVPSLLGRFLARYVCRVGAASAGAWGASMAALATMGWFLGKATLGARLAVIVGASSVGLVTFGLIASLMRLEEAEHLWNLVVARFRSDRPSSPSEITVASVESPTISGEE